MTTAVALVRERAGVGVAVGKAEKVILCEGSGESGGQTEMCPKPQSIARIYSGREPGHRARCRSLGPSATCSASPFPAERCQLPGAVKLQLDKVGQTGERGPIGWKHRCSKSSGLLPDPGSHPGRASAAGCTQNFLSSQGFPAQDEGCFCFVCLFLFATKQLPRLL